MAIDSYIGERGRLLTRPWPGSRCRTLTRTNATMLNWSNPSLGDRSKASPLRADPGAAGSRLVRRAVGRVYQLRSPPYALQWCHGRHDGFGVGAAI